MADYSITYTSRSVTFTVTGVAPGDRICFFLRTDPPPGKTVVDRDYTASASSMTKTFSGLTPGTAYVANVRFYGVGMPWWGGESFTTEGETALTPFNWTWAGLNSGGEPIAGTEKRAGLGIYVTAKEWNELTGLVGAATGAELETVGPGDLISAAVVNTVAQALGMDTVSPGDPVSADFFNRLRTAYNALAG